MHRRPVGPGDAPGLSPDAESVSRDRERQVLYGPDGRVQGVRERELWTIVRRPGLQPPPHVRGGGLSLWLHGLLIGMLELRREVVDLVTFCVGYTVILICAVAGAYLTQSLGWSAVTGYGAVLFFVWLGFARESH